MPVSADDLYPVVQGAALALDKMSAKEREMAPNKAFADNYNNLLGLAKEALPTIDKRQWPPEVLIHYPDGGFPIAIARYVEFHTYLKQIEMTLATAIYPINFGLG